LILTSFLKVGSPFWQWGTELFFVGSFLGIIVAPVTDIIMGSLPKSRAGIGSAVNTTFRMVAGTIGVAVLGSILSSIYKSNFINSLSAIPTIPTNITKVASDSVGAALGIAASGKLPAATATALAQTAKNSFMDGWSVIMIISGVIFTVGAVIVIRFVSSHQSASVKENKNHK